MGSVSWMKSTDTYELGVMLTDEYISEFLDSIDCYVMGSHTYEHALEVGWPYDETPVYVLTNRNLVNNKKNVEFCSGDLKKLIDGQLKSNHRNIWMVGGALLTKECLLLKLAD
ncbi:dihydrofolate reductase family protein [Flagellimonas hymeniacidonis]|uniref:dihydrofolate reductase family protein n=1 Tax=Flagellimonas hymeniacidonis TaxID=2603628 RepID=UPI001C9D3EA3|nr:hypothetical protein [Flagellimonas hymeniacidonis]